MTQQPKALRLADALETLSPLERDAAAELRRLHEVEGRYFAALVAAAAEKQAEREAVCRIVTGLCVSDNNAEEINRAIRARGEKL